jgi:hypothetical protein
MQFVPFLAIFARPRVTLGGMRLNRVLALTVAASLMGVAAYAQTSPGPARQSIVITRVESPPKIEDYVAGNYKPGTGVAGFLQREPGDLTPASEATEAFLSYDDANLYVAFVCRAKDPSRIRARMSRRESIFSDDFVAILLDTFNDKQRAYMFFATPLGIQADGITTEGQGDDMSFDTVWRSKGQLTDFGYVVTMAIPFKSLRFPASGGPQSWGIALLRGLPVQNEQDFWPGITRRISGFASQFAEAKGLENISPGRNLQLIPYGTFTGARFLDRVASAFDSQAEGRGGVDVKVVLRDAVALDLTANPDFSQVESDEPQVTVNQRFEVFFPEKRPFFLENSAFFGTPLNLFFSRRLRDPQLGARVTGKLGGWAVGALTIDDRAPGHALPKSDPMFGDRSFNAVVRVRREFGQSSVGALVSNRDFGDSFNRVASVDSRLRLSSSWFFDGQAVVSKTKALSGQELSSTAYAATVDKAGRRVTYQLAYQDIGRDFRAPLGFIPRTDIRQATSFASYRWRPKSRFLNDLGPNSFVQATWDRAGTLQDWLVRYPFEVSFKRATGVFVRRAESMERFGGMEFRQHENLLTFFTSYLRWMDFFLSSSSGTKPNFFPAAGLAPSLANYRDASVSLTFRPTSSLLVEETYLYSHLGARPDSGQTGTIFDNHIMRSKLNYQFSRELSLRAIVDYNGVLANASLVALDRTKRLTGDLLLTYLLTPGTALYIGYTDGYANVALDPVTGVRGTRSPTTSTGRQFFVKASYLFRF